MKIAGTAERQELVGLQPYHFFENYKQLIRKKWPHHFESLVSPHHFQSSSAVPELKDEVNIEKRNENKDVNEKGRNYEHQR